MITYIYQLTEKGEAYFLFSKSGYKTQFKASLAIIDYIKEHKIPESMVYNFISSIELVELHEDMTPPNFIFKKKEPVPGFIKRTQISDDGGQTWRQAEKLEDLIDVENWKPIE